MKRWWGIRHLRYWWLRWRVYRWAGMMYECGLGLGCPNPADLRHLGDIWRGLA